MPTTTRPISTLDYTIHSVPLDATAAPAGSLNGRLTAKAFNDCLGCLSPSAIGKFFTHAYADCRMFFRSFISMGSGTTGQMIEARVNEVTQFLTLVENCGDDRNSVRNRFQRLSPQVRDLFYYVDQNYVNEFAANLQMMQEYREEMIRECQRIVSFQRQLTMVNTFYQAFSGQTPSATTTTATSTLPGGGTGPRLRGSLRPEHRPEPDPIARLFPGLLSSSGFDWRAIFGAGFPLFGGERPAVREEPVVGGEESPVSAHRGTGTTTFNLNVPGTVAYVQTAIPVAVQQKADQINALKPQFSALRNPPAVPSIYNDIIAAEDFMAMPVFDASHPAVQSALGGGVSTSINNRDIRHLLDKDSLEAHFRAHPHSYSPAKCPTCRHPEHGGMRRENLRIDTALQDEILQFMRNAIAAGGTTT